MPRPIQETHPVRSPVNHFRARANTKRVSTATGILVALGVAVSGCSDSPTAAERRITTIELHPSKVVVDDVAPIQLDAIIRDQLGHEMTARPEGMHIRWYSTDPDIATVDENGLVTPVSSGTAAIIAEITDERDSAAGTQAPDGGGITAISTSASAVTVNGVAATLELVSGSGQTGTAGTQLANDIVVRAVSKKGEAMPGLVIDFAAVTGGGSFAPGSTTTGADGTARSAWTLGSTAGTQTGSARARKGNASLTVNATASGPCLSVAPTTATLTSVGATVQLTATTAQGGTVAWASSNNAVATVNSTGLVTAVSNGSATITASLSPCAPATAAITVAQQTIESVTTSPTSVSIQAGQTAQLSATAKDAGGNTIGGLSFTWASNNTAVATVSTSGLVTGVAAGSATITASAGGKTGSSSVTVTAPQTIASVTTSPTSASVAAGQTTQLTAVAKDAGGATINGVSFTWVSNNTAVATVNTAGLVTGVATGSATITASAGGKSGSSAITVTTGQPAGAIATVTVSPASSSVPANQTIQLSATVADANGTTVIGAPVNWESNNAAVAAVNAYGLVVGASPGSATITARSGGKWGTATVTVTPAASPGDGSSVATVIVSPTSKSVELNQTVQLDAVAKDVGGNILTSVSFTWASANPSIATVDGNGLLTGKAIGSTTVTATAGSQSNSSTITVGPATPIGGGDPANFNTIRQGIRPRGFGAGSYSLKSPAPGRLAYYVATNGNDANTGTMSAPFRTINQAAQVAIAGDVVIIRDGTYQESIIVPSSGSATAPIVLQAQNRGGVVLTGGQYVVQPWFYIGNVGSTPHRYYTLKGLVFNAYGSNQDGGTAVRAFWGWTIEDCLFDNAAETGIRIVDSNIRVERTTFVNNYVHAFDVYGGYSAGTSPTDPAFRPVENLLIKDVVLRNNHTRNISGAAVSSTRVAKVAVTRGTVIDNVESYENYGSGMWLDNKNTNYTVRNSYFHHNRGVMGPTGVIAYDAGRGLYIEKNWGTGLIENNVAADNDGAGLVIVSSNDIMINNNLLIRNEQAIQFLAVTGSGYENFLLRNLTFRRTYMKGWRSIAAVWARGGDFSLGPAGMGISLDFNVYDNTNNAIQLAAWPAPLYGAPTIAKMQSIFGWEYNGSIGTIPD